MIHPSNIPDLQVILDAARDTALKEFLLKQARRNLALEVKIRTFLINQTEVPPGVNKYGQVLSLIVRHNVHGVIRLTKRSIQLLREVIQHFVRIQQNLLEEGELREAWTACSAVLSNLHLFMDKYHGPDPKLVELLSACYTQVRALLHQMPAPELRADVFAMLYASCNKTSYCIYDVKENGIVCLIHAAADAQEHAAAYDLVRQKCEGAQISQLQRKYWYAMLLQFPAGDMSVFKDLYDDNLYEIAVLLDSARDKKALFRLLEAVSLQETLSPVQLRQWARWKFDLAMELGDITQKCIACVALLLLDTDMHLYSRLRKSVSYPQFRSFIENDNVPESLKAEIYVAESDWNVFEALVTTTGSLPLLANYCAMLAEHAMSFEDLIRNIPVTYVAHHGGPQCAELLQKLIDTLRHIGHPDLAQVVYEDVLENYPGRFESLHIAAGTVNQSAES